MFALSEEHKLVQQMVRRWVDAKLAPQTAALESGELLPYDLMRDFAEFCEVQFSRVCGCASYNNLWPLSPRHLANRVVI